MSEDEAASFPYDRLTTRQRMITLEIDALTVQFKQALKDIQETIMIKELSDDLVASTKGRVKVAPNGLVYLTPSLLGISR